MRRTCPHLLGALLIALICLGGGLYQFDQLLGPTTAWIAGWLASQLAIQQPAVATLQLASRELAPIAAAMCLVLGPVFHRSSLLTGGLLFAAVSGLALLGTSVASQAGALVLAPGALLAAVLLALVIGTLTRLAAAAERRLPPWVGRGRSGPPHACARGTEHRCDPDLRLRRTDPVVQPRARRDVRLRLQRTGGHLIRPAAGGARA